MESSIKVKTKDGFRYVTYYCQVCNKQLFRTIENPKSDYYSPTLLLDCNHCHARFYVKYDIDGSVEFDDINLLIGRYAPIKL